MKSFYGTVSMLLLVLLPALSTAAQEERIVTSTQLVSVNVIVTDKSGHYVRGLAREDFEVFADKSRQRIAHFSADPAPVSLGIVFEFHPVTSERTRAMLVALRQFAKNLRSDDDFFFMAFGGQGSVTTEFVPTEDQILNHLAAVRPGGPSSLYDAVYLAADRLRTKRNLKKALLIVSDGADDKSATSYKELRSRLREFDVQIYAVGISDPTTDRASGYGRWVFEDVTRQKASRSFLENSEASFGRAVLAEIARVSGGTAFYPEAENEPELVGICTQIALELRRQYTISFYPADVSSSKAWHKIKIGMVGGRRGLSLSYRQGYRLQRQSR